MRARRTQPDSAVRKLSSLALAAIALSGLAPSVARANEAGNHLVTSAGRLADEEKEIRFRIYAASEGVMMTNEDETLNAAGLGVGIRYALSENWGGGGSIHQAFSIDKQGALFTEMDFKIVYALTGTLILKEKSLLVGDTQVANTQEFNRGGFRIEGILNQYLFNSSSAVVPFTGVGLAVGYEFPTSLPAALYVNFRADFVTNGTITLQPYILGVGLVF